MLAKVWAVLAVVLGSFVLMSRGDLVEIVSGVAIDKRQVRLEGRVVRLHSIQRGRGSFLAEMENGEIVVHIPKSSSTREQILRFQGATGPTRQVASVFKLSSGLLVLYSDESVDALSYDQRRKTVYGIKTIVGDLLLKTNGEFLTYEHNRFDYENLDHIVPGPIEDIKTAGDVIIFVQQGGRATAYVGPSRSSPVTLKFNYSEVKHIYKRYNDFVLRGHDDIIREYDSWHGFELQKTYSLAGFREVSSWCEGFYTVDENGTIGGLQLSLIRTWPANATGVYSDGYCDSHMFTFLDGSLEMHVRRYSPTLVISAKTTFGIRKVQPFESSIAVLDEGDNLILLRAELFPGDRKSYSYSLPEGSVKSLHSSASALAVEFKDGSFLMISGDLEKNLTLPSTTELFRGFYSGFAYVSERGDPSPPATQQNFSQPIAFAVVGVIGLIGLVGLVGLVAVKRSYFQSSKKAEEVGQPQPSL